MDTSTSWERKKREKREKFTPWGQKPGNLTHRVHNKKRESPQKQGLPGKKKGDRENLSPVYGGHSEYEEASTRA
jgi:hypothetical protein